MPATPDSLDIVYLLKRESTAKGGDDNDASEFPVPIDPLDDGVIVGALFPGESGSLDKGCAIWRNGSDLVLRDPNHSSGLNLENFLKVKVTTNDTTQSYLNDAIAVDGITKTVLSPGSDEQLELKVAGDGNAPYSVNINPETLATVGNNPLHVISNDYAALEFKQSQTDYGRWSTYWQRTPSDDVTIKVKFVLKGTGTGSNVRLALRVKARATGEDTSTAFDNEQAVVVAVTTTTIGQVFEGTFTVSSSIFTVGDAVTINIGRDGNEEIGGGSADDFSNRIQLIAILMTVP